MQQLSFTLEPGLAQKYRDMRECFAACVYQRGLGRVAAAVDEKPSNLSAMLSGERNLDTGVVEKYMREFGDKTPALFWAARELQDAGLLRDQVIAQLPALAAQLQNALAILNPPQRKRS